jgi:hypothetical protein
MSDQKIIKAIKNFDTVLFLDLLDDNWSYMNVAKARFIKKA